MSLNSLLTPAGNKNYTINGTEAGAVLRSYQHASRIFVDGEYRLSPKYGFLFYVEFDFNPMISNVSNLSAQELGMIVKSVTLPKFTVDVKTHNAYNRKNIIQNKISYDPVTIVFHDDQADNVRNFWYDYYSFYYRDSDFADATYNIISKYQERPSFDWGYTPRPNGGYNSSVAFQNYQYIQAIRIYSLYQKNFSEYELINPIITSFKHGDHVNGENNLLEHQMSVQFETVKYRTGYTTKDSAGGYIDLHYDQVKSPIAPSQGTDLISNGAGGYAQAPATVIDLANFNLQTAGGSVVLAPEDAALNAAFVASVIGNQLIDASSGSGSNSGGFVIPSLGSLTSGLSNSNILGQQLSQAGVQIVGQAVNTLVGGVVQGIAQGIGPGGGTIVNLAIQAIRNPSAALNTVKNMAIRWVTGQIRSVVNYGVNAIAKEVTNTIKDTVSGALGDINRSLGETIFGSGTLTENIKEGFKDLFSINKVGSILSDAEIAANNAALGDWNEWGAEWSTATETVEEASDVLDWLDWP